MFCCVVFTGQRACCFSRCSVPHCAVRCAVQSLAAPINGAPLPVYEFTLTAFSAVDADAASVKLVITNGSDVGLLVGCSCHLSRSSLIPSPPNPFPPNLLE